MGKKVQILLWVIIAVAVVAGIGLYVYNTASMVTDGNVHPEVTFEIKDYGTVKLELYPEYAPNTVANFIKLVENGYYNEKVVYGKDEICVYIGRNQEGDIINPKRSLIFGESEEDYDYAIKGEFIANGFNKNTLKHEKGVLTLIRNDYTQYAPALYEESYNSGNAQIGIMMTDSANNLNGSYAAFGRVIEGLDIIENIYNNVEVKKPEVTEQEVATPEATNTNTTAVDNTTAEETVAEEPTTEEDTGIKAFENYPVISSASVDTKGIDFGNPEIEEAFDYEAYMYNMMSSYYGNGSY